jgi:hypothetical protein
MSRFKELKEMQRAGSRFVRDFESPTFERTVSGLRLGFALTICSRIFVFRLLSFLLRCCERWLRLIIVPVPSEKIALRFFFRCKSWKPSIHAFLLQITKRFDLEEPIGYEKSCLDLMLDWQKKLFHKIWYEENDVPLSTLFFLHNLTRSPPCSPSTNALLFEYSPHFERI